MWLLFRAEWRKMTGNRWLTGCFIWLWPFTAAMIAFLLVLVVAVDVGIRERFADNPYTWTDASLFFWAIPNSIIGRLLIIGFTAGLFGGEYQWETWKHLIFRRGRVTLIVMKFVALAVFVMVAFGLTSIIWVIGIGVVQLVAGGDYPPALDEIPPSYAAELALQVSTALLSTLILAAIAAVIALVTRSVLASIIGGLFAAFIDGFIGAALMVAYFATELRLFPSLYRFTISYNVDNLLNWANDGRSSPVLGNLPQDEFPVFGQLYLDPPLMGNHWGLSLLLLGVWMLGLVGLAAFSFYRQDLTS